MVIVLFSLALPVVWFAFWVPVLRAVFGRCGLSRGLAVAVSVFGPLAGLAALASARYGRSRRSPQMVDQW